MRKIQHLIPGFIMVCSLLFMGSSASNVEYDDRIPQLEFAAQEIEKALKETDKGKLKVTLLIKADESNPEAFTIRNVGKNRIEVSGTDSKGAMYGGLEVAELIQLGLPITDQEQKPYVEKRGVKINIPLDIRTPSFDDSGEAAQRNVITMWDFSFWKEYLDNLARYRYNVVSLWAAHPFPTMIKMEDYPDIAMDDVHYIDPDKLDASLNKSGDDIEYTGEITAVKKMSIDEKINFWTRVFDYAADRGIEIIMVHWNVFTHGATGKYGITPEQDNPKTIEYLRKCVSQMLLTYPQITGVGVCAGENDDRYLRDEYMTEHFIFNSYGKGIMDVKEQQPQRDIRLIIRRHSTEYEDINNAFKDYNAGTMEVSVKYAVAHMYSSRRPQEWEKRIVDEGWSQKYKAWLNLRNDDIFMHRWGSPDYARDFIKWMPHEQLTGFYMGSDTYVWGREFISKNPETSGWLEIEKHWYNFKLWGQLAYNNDLSDEYWEAVLKHHFPGVDGKLLLKAWESVSEVIPQVNRSVWSPTDGSFGAEACRRTSGFLYLDGYHFERPAMVLNRIENAPDQQCVTVTDWAKAYYSGEKLEGLLPLQIAENLDGYAKVALDALPVLKKQIGDNIELKETLNDIESMAYLGRYYADKMRGAAKLALYREGGRKEQKYLDESVAHLEDAVEEWKGYADVLETQYKTQVGSRANNQDWYGTLKYVKKEVDIIREEADYPVVRFTNLTDGAKLPEGSDLRVEVEATDGNGIPEVSLRIRGILLKADESNDGKFVWSASANNLLKSLKSGIYHLEAEVADKNGLRSSAELSVVVGDVIPETKNAWKDEIYQVILNEGEKIWEGDVIEFPDLNCFLTISDEGAISLQKGTPKNKEGQIWGTNGKANRPKWKVKPEPVIYHFYMVVENGQMKLYREKKGRPTVTIYETPPVSGPGPFKLGMTASRSLIVFREEGENTKIVWRSNR
ncbi:Ig-like domain-containing protein [Bacteroidota bacterium]